MKKTPPKPDNEIYNEEHTILHESQQPIKNKEYLELRIPKLDFQSAHINTYIVFVLVIFAFLLGMLFSKVMYLQKGLGTEKATAAQPTQQAAVQAQPNQQPQLQPGQKVTVGVGHFPVRGQDSAKVTIVAFEDWRCPFCEKFFTETEPQIIKEYVDTGKAKLYYRQYQFLGAASVVAGNAAECANEQGKFWDFHDYMYKNQPSESDTSIYTTNNLTTVAGQLGMDTTQFQSCLSSNKYQKNVDQDLTEGQKAGVSGTPTVFVNGSPLVGAEPYATFKTLIDQELAKK